MVKKQSKEKGFALLSVSSLIVKVISIFFIPALIAIITESGNGLFSAANQVFAFAYALTNSGTLNAITKMIAEYCAQKSEEEAERAFTVARTALAAIGAVISILLFLFAGKIAALISFPDATYSIMVLAPCVFLTAVVSGYRGYFQGRQDFSARSSSQVIEQVVHVVASLALAAAGMYLVKDKSMALIYACTGANAGSTVAALVAMIHLMMYMKKYRKAQPKKLKPIRFSLGDKQEIITTIKIFIAYSLPITVSAGLQNFSTLVDAANAKGRLLASGLNSTMADAMYSYLSKYQQLVYVPLVIVVALASTILPDLSMAKATSDKLKFKNALDYAYRWCFIISIPSSVVMGLFSEALYSALKLQGGHELLLYGSFVCVLMSVVNIQSSILQGMTRMYRLVVYLAIGIVAKVWVNYMLISIPSVRINGAIVGSVVCFIIPVVLNEIYIRKHVKTKVTISHFFVKPFLASGLMAVVMYIYNSSLAFILTRYIGASKIGGYIAVALPLVIASCVGLAVFLIAMTYMGGFSKKDLDMIPHRFRKRIPKSLIKKMHE